LISTATRFPLRVNFRHSAAMYRNHLRAEDVSVKISRRKAEPNSRVQIFGANFKNSPSRTSRNFQQDAVPTFVRRNSFVRSSISPRSSVRVICTYIMHKNRTVSPARVPVFYTHRCSSETTGKRRRSKTIILRILYVCERRVNQHSTHPPVIRPFNIRGGLLNVRTSQAK